MRSKRAPLPGDWLRSFVRWGPRLLGVMVALEVVFVVLAIAKGFAYAVPGMIVGLTAAAQGVVVIKLLGPRILRNAAYLDELEQ